MYTYKITLVNEYGFSRTVEVSHTDCISAVNKAKRDFGKGWTVRECLLVRAG